LIDDLLECECILEQIRKYGLEDESKPPSEKGDLEGNSEDKADLEDESSSSNDDEEPGFVTASQYSGKPVGRSLCLETDHR
jgi:hypothetical protein